MNQTYNTLKNLVIRTDLPIPPYHRPAMLHTHTLSLLVCVCVIHLDRLLVIQPAFPYGASSELIDRYSGRVETISHTTHRDSKATTPYLLAAR